MTNQFLDDLRMLNQRRQTEWPGAEVLEGVVAKLFRSNELSGELGEANNVVKKLVREELGIQGSRDTVEHLGEELADIIICVDLLAAHYDIDLITSIASKFNRTSNEQGLSTKFTDNY